jgi:hypothetical protein
MGSSSLREGVRIHANTLAPKCLPEAFRRVIDLIIAVSSVLVGFGNQCA